MTTPTRRTLLAIAATSVLAIGALILAWEYGWGLAGQPAQAALSVETQTECAAVAHEHTTWAANIKDLRALAFTTDPVAAKLKLTSLKADADRYAAATGNRPDQPAKALAAAVTQYTFDAGNVALELQLRGQYSQATLGKAVSSADAVDTAYQTFNKQTCRQT